MSFYTSLTGLKAAQTGLDVTAQNIANAETTGFKKSRVSFADIVPASISSNPKTTVGIGVLTQTVQQNFGIGPIEQTGSALDLAINGDGLFATKSPLGGQTYYTRAGELKLDSAGFITDSDGNRLQMMAGSPPAGAPVDAKVALTNPAGSKFAGIAVGNDGSITASYADGSNIVVGAVALASFNDPSALKAVGSSRWIVTGASGAATYGQPGIGVNGQLMSGALEHSNVDLAEELVKLITAQRYYQANAKAIDTATQISSTIINLRT